MIVIVQIVPPPAALPAFGHRAGRRRVFLYPKVIAWDFVIVQIAPLPAAPPAFGHRAGRRRDFFVGPPKRLHGIS